MLNSRKDCDILRTFFILSSKFITIYCLEELKFILNFSIDLLRILLKIKEKGKVKKFLKLSRIVPPSLQCVEGNRTKYIPRAGNFSVKILIILIP